MTRAEMEEFINSKNYDIKISHNGRWIDQKCTPDVIWSIADFVLNYVDDVATSRIYYDGHLETIKENETE